MNYVRILLLSVLVLFVAFLVSFGGVVYGQGIDRLPTATEVISGKVCVRSNPKGDFVAWYGDGGNLNVIACAKSECSKVSAKRAVAAFLSGPPTLERLNSALKPYQAHPHKTPELRAVWEADFSANCKHIHQ